MTDHRDGTVYVATGEATFTPEPDGRIRWAEHGTLRWADQATPVTRTLFLLRDRPGHAGPHLDPAESHWRVTFQDGRDFHPWTARPVEHPCGPDLYTGHVEMPEHSDHIPAPADWTVRWRVTGPEKDYTMVSRYSARGVTPR